MRNLSTLDAVAADGRSLSIRQQAISRARLRQVYALLLVLALTPSVALAGSTLFMGITTFLQDLVNFTQGPAGIAIGCLALAYGVWGMVVNSRQGNGVGKFVVVLVGVVAWFLIPDIIAQIATPGAMM